MSLKGLGVSGVTMLYNDRSYDGRGWTCFEEAVSGEVVARLSALPRMRAILDALPPKVLSLSSERGVESIEVGALETRVEMTVQVSAGLERTAQPS